MHFYIEIKDGELWSTSHIDGVVQSHGPGLEGVKRAYAAIMAEQLNARMTAVARQRAADLAGRIFKAQISKSESQLKFRLSGKLKVGMPADQKAFFTILSSEGAELYAGHDLTDAVKSLSLPTLNPPSPV